MDYALHVLPLDILVLAFALFGGWLLALIVCLFADVLCPRLDATRAFLNLKD